jgi:hypothetical protein
MQRGQSGDYILAKKQLAIFSEIKNNAVNLGTVNPTKKNKYTYNNNLSIQLPFITSTCKTQGRTKQVSSFELFQNYKDGNTYNNIRCLKIVEE